VTEFAGLKFEDAKEGMEVWSDTPGYRGRIGVITELDETLSLIQVKWPHLAVAGWTAPHNVAKYEA